MKNLLKILVVSVFLTTGTLGLAAVKAPSQGILQKRSATLGTVKQKQCEICKRGPDGKMVCEPVPCP